MKSNSICNPSIDYRFGEQHSGVSFVKQGVRLHEVLLPISHDHYNFKKKQIHSGEMSPVKTLFKVKKLHFGNSPVLIGKCLLLW